MTHRILHFSLFTKKIEKIELLLATYHYVTYIGQIDYLIICPVFLKNQAEKLANFHRNNSQMNVKVVTLDLIYQEFASGKQDVAAIRNFVK